MATQSQTKKNFSHLTVAAFPLVVVDIVSKKLLFSTGFEDLEQSSKSKQTAVEVWLKNWSKKQDTKRLEHSLSSVGVFFDHTNLGGKEFQISCHLLQQNGSNVLLIQFLPHKSKAEIDENFRWVDQLPEGIIIHRAGKVLYLNAQAEEILGVNPKKAIGKPFEKLYPTELQTDVKQRLDKWACGDSTDYSEFELIDPEGGVKYIGERTVIIESGDTPVCQTILSDLSIHKRWIHEKMRAQLAEEINQILKHEIKEHKTTQYELEQAKNFNVAVIESSIDMIIAENADGKISVFNRAAEKQYGYKRDEVLGKSTGILFATEKEYKRINAGLKKKNSLTIEVLNKRKNGDVFTSFLSASILHTTDGKYLGSMGVSRDISDQKRAAETLRRSEELYRDLFDNMSDAYLMFDENGKLTHWNKAGRSLLGVSVKKANSLDVLNWLSGEDRKALKDARKQVKKTGKTLKGLEYVLTNANKEQKCVQVNMSPVFDKGKFVGTRELLRDVTEQKSAQDAAEAQAAKIQSIFESTAYMIWSVNKAGRLTSFNSRYAAEFKKRSGTSARIGLKALGFTSYTKSQLKDEWKSRYSKVLAGKAQQFEVEVDGKKGQSEWYSVVLNPIDSKNGEVEEISGIAHSVSFRKQAEGKIKEQAAKINSIFDSTAMLIYTLDDKFRITSYNVNFAKTIQRYFNVEIQIGSNIISLLKPFMRADLYKRLKKLYTKTIDGQYVQFEGPLKTTNGNIIWIETFLNPIFSENSNVHEISCMAHEITDKKIIEKQMRDSLEEKEILLQEVHHRVKNNLQVISSILNLQSSYVKDPNTLNILRESQNRIKSMSFIHESLYQTSDFSSIDFSDYILSLSKNLVHSYSMNAGLVELDTQFDRVFLNLDQAIPCGLIVNELVSNALKYAFPNQRKGKLLMQINEANNKVRLVIKDDGVGVPEDFDFDRSDTLGLQLVFTLIEQLDGEVAFHSEPQKGTEYLITFDKIT